VLSLESAGKQADEEQPESTCCGEAVRAADEGVRAAGKRREQRAERTARTRQGWCTARRSVCLGASGIARRNQRVPRDLAGIGVCCSAGSARAGS